MNLKLQHPVLQFVLKAAPVVDPLPESHEAEPAEHKLLELAKQSCKAKADTDTHTTGAVQTSVEKLKEMADKKGR